MPEKIILHVDMDAFYASIEMRDNPSLKNTPLIIGALPQERGVVATCNYIARTYGVHSGMSIKTAYQLCPNGVYMHPDFVRYKKVSDELHAIWSAYTTKIEYIAFDEAYLDLTNIVASFDDAKELAYELKQKVLDQTNLTCSVGIGYSLSAAKLSSEEKKPNGYFEIRTPDAFKSLIADRNVRILPFVGPKTEQKLHEMGIETVSDIYGREKDIQNTFKKHGDWIVSLSQGIDTRDVTPRTTNDAKSLSREVTFQTNVTNKAFLKRVLFLVTIAVYNQLKTRNVSCKGVAIKVTYFDLSKQTRQKKLKAPVSLFDAYKTACELLNTVTDNPIRLIGVRTYDFVKDTPPNISDNRIKDEFDKLKNRYNYDFSEHIQAICSHEGLHKIIDYMIRYETWLEINK